MKLFAWICKKLFLGSCFLIPFFQHRFHHWYSVTNCIIFAVNRSIWLCELWSCEKQWFWNVLFANTASELTLLFKFWRISESAFYSSIRDAWRLLICKRRDWFIWSWPRILGRALSGCFGSWEMLNHFTNTAFKIVPFLCQFLINCYTQSANSCSWSSNPSQCIVSDALDC
jgi:hypothetical protein